MKSFKLAATLVALSSASATAQDAAAPPPPAVQGVQPVSPGTSVTPAVPPPTVPTQPTAPSAQGYAPQQAPAPAKAAPQGYAPSPQYAAPVVQYVPVQQQAVTPVIVVNNPGPIHRALGHIGTKLATLGQPSVSQGTATVTQQQTVTNATIVNNVQTVSPVQTQTIQIQQAPVQTVQQVQYVPAPTASPQGYAAPATTVIQAVAPAAKHGLFHKR